MTRDHRRLAAIVSADVVGYSLLMGRDDSATLAGLNAHRQELFDPKIAEYGGRIVKTMGDGLLLEFPSVVDAVSCAVDVQRGMAERNAGVPLEKRIDFRVGINVGEIIIENEDIFGDGVNVAARLQELAEPGGICVSTRVHEDTRGKLDVTFEDAGEQQLKNIERPVRVHRILIGEGPGRWELATATSTKAPLALPDRPSIAVLPFQNMSGDPEQEYFADGMVEEIITVLSRTRLLFVIARNSSFTYKGRAVDIRQVGRELGVRYVLEGSVRKSTNRLRITGQLIDTVTGVHLWGESFDGKLEDLFALQDEVAASVVGAIAPKLELAEIERAKRKPTERLDAYDYYLRGTASAHQFSSAANGVALRLFYKAIEVDPNFAAAYGGAVRCYAQRTANGWMSDPAQEIAETMRLARRAVALGKDDANALVWGGLGLALVGRELDDGAAFVDQALMLNPNLAAAWHVSGLIRIWLGEPEAALEREARAMRLSPLDPVIGQMQSATAWAHLFAGQYDDASSWARKAIREMPNWLPAHIVAAASNAIAGRLDAAQEAAASLRQLSPGFHILQLDKTFPLRRPADVARLVEGLREAGLPD